MAGNAIVIKVETQDSIFVITDYGNEFGPLTRSEIDGMFYIGPVNGDHKFAVLDQMYEGGIIARRCWVSADVQVNAWVKGVR